MAYAEVHNHIRPKTAAGVVMHARAELGFDFHMVQSDNGPEFSRYFEARMTQQNVQVRHSRLGRPNDNAHIERFNRTIQEECLGNVITYKQSIEATQAKINRYLEYYNYKRVHLSLQLRTPSEMLRRS